MRDDVTLLPIRGHSCAGLLQLQEGSSYNCQPSLDWDGRMAGCDATNPIPFEFCPMCGQAFREAALPQDEKELMP